MARQDSNGSNGGGGVGRSAQNAAFADSSFLFGGNAAYIEQLHAAYKANPAGVDPEWREFFGALNDDGDSVAANAKGASWKRPNWPIAPQGDLVAALDGQWPVNEKALADKIKGKAASDGKGEISAAELHRATQDSVRAIMMIRAYRMRGHLHANLDPLGLDPQKDHEELHPVELRLHRGRLRPQDLHRPRARHGIRDHPRDAGRCCAAPIARPSAGNSCTFPIRPRRPGSRSASKDRTRRSLSPRRASAPSCRSWSRLKASRSSST